MKRRWMIMMVCATVAALAVAADPVLPTYTGTNQPGAVTRYFNSTTAPTFEDSAVTLTNMLVLTSGGATQDLTGLTVRYRVGGTVATTLYTGSVDAVQGSNGLWFGNATLGDAVSDQVTLQVEIVGDTVTLIENWLKWYTQAPLD